MTPDEFAPCRLHGAEGDLYSLVFNDFDATADVFEEFDEEGGGYGWHGVVDALVRMKAPALKRKVQYDPEASLFVALSKSPEALSEVAGLIRAAIADPELLREALRNANPKLMG